MREIIINEKSIKYEIIIKKVKNINLRIKSDMSITVSANKNVSTKKIEEFIFAKSDFVFSALAKFEQKNKNSNLPKAYISGEKHLILGDEYFLMLEKSNKQSVKIINDNIWIFVKDVNDFEEKERVYKKWLTKFAFEFFLSVDSVIKPLFSELQIPTVTLKMRDMKTRWGSCNPKTGVITLNLKLIEFEAICTEYVTLHEYCHFIHPNHSKDFYNFLAKFMPEWKQTKKMLDNK